MYENVLIKNALLLDELFKPVGIRHITIKDGVIIGIDEDLNNIDKIPEYDAQKAYVSPGWMDMHVHFREPGYENKETIVSGCNAAAFGGFTSVACMPNTNPAIDTINIVKYIIERSKDLAVVVHPIACVTKGRNGKQLAEMIDLHRHGAVAFSDDGDPVQNAQVMRLALEYASMLNCPIINHEEELYLSRPSDMNEGVVSSRLGLEGSHSVAEEIMIARDILLAKCTGGHVHVAHLSTLGGMELIQNAKKKGIKITTEVCPHHFDLTENMIEQSQFDPNYKMHPPLRTSLDVQAMIEGLKKDVIDVICTDHAPHAREEKEVEFTSSPNGIIGLETCWSTCVKCLLKPKHLTLDHLLKKLVNAPRRILNIPIPHIKVGQVAELTIFNTDEKWLFDVKNVRSKSINSPYLNTKMTGRATAIYNRKQLIVNRYKS